MSDDHPSADLRALYDGIDWSATPLGPRETWSHTLTGALDLVMRTRFPSVMFWGPELVLLYNDAYIQMIGDKHPAALGAPTKETFEEAWQQIGPLIHGVRSGAGATWATDALIPLERHGYLEDCYFTFSYSPVHGPDGSIEGVLDIAAETTTEVLSRRRLELLARLADVIVGAETVTELRLAALSLLRDHSLDLPAVDIRLPVSADEEPSLVTSTSAASQILPATLDADLLTSSFHVQETGRDTVVWQALDTSRRVGHGGAVLVCAVSDRLPFDDDYRDFLRLLAGALSQALTRLEVLESERRAAVAERDISVALQQSLLSTPAQTDAVQVAARYVPAGEVAQIGGDWYDSFHQPDGTLTVTVGDIAGHDRTSAVAMAQVRNLIRGIAFAIEDSPAGVLEVLDRALAGLGVDAVASAVLARIEQTAEQALRGERTLRWSRAGHPPPVVIRPDGTAELLDLGGELLLGVDPDTSRKDQDILLAPGSTVVLYTDGLVERRRVPIDLSLEVLRSELEGQHVTDAELLCDKLLLMFADEPDDDICVMVLRT